VPILCPLLPISRCEARSVSVMGHARSASLGNWLLVSRLVAQLRARSMPVVAILKDRSCEADQHRLNALAPLSAFVDASRTESMFPPFGC